MFAKLCYEEEHEISSKIKKKKKILV